ncbi:hypothetical protein SDJN02_19406, partial [Cucurbita argyrosperma subsp. argyrosperma]
MPPQVLLMMEFHFSLKEMKTATLLELSNKGLNDFTGFKLIRTFHKCCEGRAWLAVSFPALEAHFNLVFGNNYEILIFVGQYIEPKLKAN